MVPSAKRNRSARKEEEEEASRVLAFQLQQEEFNQPPVVWHPSRLARFPHHQHHRFSHHPQITTPSVNVDQMSYEDLLELGDAMGDVAKDRWKRKAPGVLQSLPTFRWKQSHHSSNADNNEYVMQSSL